MKILLRGMTILPMKGEKVIEKGEIAVQDGKILTIGSIGTVPVDFEPDEIIEAAGMVATPGLVNTHTHAAMVLLRGYADDMMLMPWLTEKIWPIEEKLTKDDIYWGSLLACVEMIRSGTTTFADMYFFMNETAQAVKESGMRACLSRGLIGAAPNGEDSLNQNIQFIRDWNNQAEGRITCMLGPHAPYTCPPEYLKKVMQAADELGVGLHIHVAETRTEDQDIKEQYGASPVAHLEALGFFERPVLAAHCVHLNEEDVDILVKRNVGIAHCPQSNMKLASGIAPIAKLLNVGARVSIGTDGASSNNNLDMIEETRTVSLLQKVAQEDPTVLPASQAAMMATAGGARALRLEEQIGTLEPGKCADIVLWDWQAAHLNPPHDPFAHLVYAAKGSDAHTVIINGQIVMRNRKVLTLDEEEIIKQAKRCAYRLVEETENN